MNKIKNQNRWTAGIEKHLRAILGSISSGQNKVLAKIIFRKLQDLVWIRHVVVPIKDTNMAAVEVG